MEIVRSSPQKVATSSTIPVTVILKISSPSISEYVNVKSLSCATSIQALAASSMMMVLCSGRVTVKALTPFVRIKSDSFSVEALRVIPSASQNAETSLILSIAEESSESTILSLGILIIRLSPSMFESE